MSRNNYLVSVVTPFHNTNLTYFSKCFESMVKQTIGFEHVEWVITLHNCEPEYVEAVRSMAAPWPNIRLFELYNDNRTASSPRNECLKHVTAKYVCFIDADDFYFPDCLEVAVRTMEEYDGDIGNFRTEVRFSSGLAFQFADMTMEVDQTQPVIVYKKGDRRIGRLFTPMNGAVWNKIYRRQLLDDHAITFQEDIRLGEDVCFNMVCLKYAKTYLVMPQHIGNVYFRNAGSLAENASGAASVEDAVQYMEDILNWIRYGLDTGYDMSNLLWLPLAGAAKRLATPGIPPQTLGRLMTEFAKVVPDIPPIRLTGKRQAFTQEQMDGMMQMIRSAFLRSDPAAANKSINILWDILARNKDTELGVKYNFETIKNYSAFSNQVPLSDYHFYAPLVELTTRLAENNIFCNEPLAGYAFTSGTDGSAKRIPYTPRHLGAYVSFLKYTLAGNDTFLLMGSIPRELEYKDGAYLDSISGAALRELKDEIWGASFARRHKDNTVTSPAPLLFPEEAIDPRYARLLFALLDPDITQIIAPFTWGVLDTLQYLEKNYESLVEDIEKGQLSSGPDLPAALKETLEGLLKPDPGRAAELREIFAQGFEGILSRLWPKCRQIVAGGSGAFSIYTRKLRCYCGDVKLNNGIYAASEALIGQSLGNGSEEYRLLTDSAFFEFLEPGAEAPVQAEDTQAGRIYEVIVTNCAGLYRYRTGDIIRVIRFDNGAPVFTFEYRSEDCLRIFDLCLCENELESVIFQLEEATGADIRDFCVSASKEEGLTLYLESGPQDREEKPSILSADLIDKTLQKVSTGYAKARSAGDIPAPKLRILQPQTHLLYRDKTMFRDNIAPDQIKPVRVLRTEEQMKFFTALSD